MSGGSCFGVKLHLNGVGYSRMLYRESPYLEGKYTYILHTNYGYG